VVDRESWAEVVASKPSRQARRKALLIRRNFGGRGGSRTRVEQFEPVLRLVTSFMVACCRLP
jgi:hypothetical protein